MSDKSKPIDLTKWLTVNPKMDGQVCFKGTDIPLDFVISNMEDGITMKEILRFYPDINPVALKEVLQLILADMELKAAA